MHASLKWFSMTFGAAFPMDHWATKHFRFHAANQPREVINLLILMKRSQGTHRVLVAQMLMVAAGCIRLHYADPEGLL